MEVFYKANSIAEDKQAVVFLSRREDVLPSSGPAPQDQTLATLFDTLKCHFEPKPLVIAEQFYFHKRSQGPMECTAEYIAKL